MGLPISASPSTSASWSHSWGRVVFASGAGIGNPGNSEQMRKRQEIGEVFDLGDQPAADHADGNFAGHARASVGFIVREWAVDQRIQLLAARHPVCLEFCPVDS